jgi:hypothetical protein
MSRQVGPPVTLPQRGRKLRLRTNRREFNFRFAVQPPEQPLVTFRGTDSVTVNPPQLRRDKAFILLAEDHWSKFGVVNAAFVQGLADDYALKSFAQTFARRFMAKKASRVGFRNDQ